MSHIKSTSKDIVRNVLSIHVRKMKVLGKDLNI